MGHDGPSKGRNIEQEKKNRMKAFEMAEAHMKSLGKSFPEREGGEKISDWYERTREYSALEGTAYVTFLQKLSERPIAFDSTERDGGPKPYTQKWGRPYYD